ncbi:MAG: hypothetical protein ACOCXJ_00155 [Planctomycetota bacterium]
MRAIAGAVHLDKIRITGGEPTLHPDCIPLVAAGQSLLPAPEADLPTSRVWYLAGIDPTACTVGFITTVSDPFCTTCDRIRWTDTILRAGTGVRLVRMEHP